ncbi:P-loop containing nucleoside triphosphate hydrolase protein [Lipomyces kononenkoae]
MTEALYNEFKADHDHLYLYHGQLDADKKDLVFEKWIKGDYALLFCTSGFGVGMDYDRVSLVVHYEGIWNLVDFVQESGRAGRDNQSARSLVLLRVNWTPDSGRMVAQDAKAILEYTRSFFSFFVDTISYQV